MNSIKFWLHFLYFLLILTAGTISTGLYAFLTKFGIRPVGSAPEIRAVDK